MTGEIKEMQEMDGSAWEKLCERCGLCCFEKIEDESGTIFFTQTPCRYLDVVTRECRVYDRRFSINPECVKLTPDLVREIRWLHDDCGYRKALETPLVNLAFIAGPGIRRRRKK